MIIELSSLFVPKLKTEGFSRFADKFEDMINSHSNGFHLLLMPTALSEVVLDLGRDHLSNRQKATVVEILENYNELAGLARSATFTILCVPDKSKKIAERENQNIIMHMAEFSREVLYSRFSLIVEDAVTDGGFWTRLAQACCKEVGHARSYELKVENGGGVRIAEVFDRCRREGIPAFCVADSDRQWPAGPIGETARKLQHAHQNCGPLSQLHILNGREVENYITSDMMVDIYAGNQATIDKIEFFAKLEKAFSKSGYSNHASFPLFFDIKRGLRAKDFKVLDQTGKAFMGSMLQAGNLTCRPEEMLDDAEVVAPIAQANLMKLLNDFVDKPQNRYWLRSKIRKGGGWSELREVLARILALSVAPEYRRV